MNKYMEQALHIFNMRLRPSEPWFQLWQLSPAQLAQVKDTAALLEHGAAVQVAHA